MWGLCSDVQGSNRGQRCPSPASEDHSKSNHVVSGHHSFLPAGSWVWAGSGSPWPGKILFTFQSLAPISYPLFFCFFFCAYFPLVTQNFPFCFCIGLLLISFSAFHILLDILVNRSDTCLPQGVIHSLQLGCHTYNLHRWVQGSHWAVSSRHLAYSHLNREFDFLMSREVSKSEAKGMGSAAQRQPGYSPRFSLPFLLGCKVAADQSAYVSAS